MSSNSLLARPSWAVLRHLLYNNNPFYVISAALVLAGVWRSVAGQEAAAAGWPMFGLLCGYLVLLAGAAWAIIRLGGVWQDARTLLVVIVLMLVALSMSFDPLTLLDLPAGRQFLLLGLMFSVALSEAILRALGIRLTWIYRGPYYALLVLLFAYPVWLAELVQRREEAWRAASLMLFPTLGALILLALYPAARWGRNTKCAAGTPWPWPLFPWTMFFFLALGVGVRAYSLAFAFDGGSGATSGFRAYWLAPLVLACALLTLEMGLASRNRFAQFVAMVAPLTLVPLALAGPGIDPTQVEFLSLLRGALSSPICLTAGLLLAFYLFALGRRVALAEGGVMLALALLAVCDAGTVDWRTFASPQPAPLGAILVWQLTQSLRTGATWRLLVVTAMTLGAGCWPFREHDLVASGYLPFHLFVLAILATGLTFNDRLARGLRRTAPYFIPLLAALAAAVYPAVFINTPLTVHAAYAAALTGIAAVYWRREQEMAHLVGLLVTSMWLAAAALRAGHAQLDKTPLAEGRDWLVGGFVCLVAGLLISLAKGGVLTTAWQSLAAWNRRMQTHRPTESVQ